MDNPIIVLGRRGGRPRAAEPRSVVSTWVPAREHDALIREAQRREISVSALVRERLTVTRSPIRKPRS